MKEGTIFLLAGAVLVASVGPSVGQASPGPNSEPVKVEADVVYDSNVAASSAALAAARGLARADEIYTPSLDLNYVKQVGVDSFFLSGQAGYDFYQHNTILDRERLNAQSGFEAEVANCQLTLRGSFARAQSSLAGLILTTVQNTQQDLSTGLDGTCNTTGKLVPSVSVTQDWLTNSNFVYLTTDDRSTAVQGNILYNSPQLGEISLLAQYTDTQFPHRLFFNGTGIQEDGYTLYAGGLKLLHHFGSKIDFQVSVSKNSLKEAISAAPGFNGITYDSSLNYRIGPRLSANLSFSRKTNPSNYLNASYAIVQGYGAEADYQLTSATKFSLGASDTRDAYQGEALVPGVDLTRDDMKSFYSRLGFNISPRLSVNLTASQNQRHTDLIGYSYTSTQFGLLISQAF
jgi:hypothetical protein